MVNALNTVSGAQQQYAGTYQLLHCGAFGWQQVYLVGSCTIGSCNHKYTGRRACNTEHKATQQAF